MFGMNSCWTLVFIFLVLTKPFEIHKEKMYCDLLGTEISWFPAPSVGLKLSAPKLLIDLRGLHGLR
jgi:hypothetical protein